MHHPIREKLEEYLRGEAASGELREFHSHMETCTDCRDGVTGMRDQARLLRCLRPPEGAEPRPGFYARVMSRIESKRSVSIWSFLLAPAFNRGLVVASVLLILLLGSYVVSSEVDSPLSPSSPEVILAAEPNPSEMVGLNPQRDRDTVLLTLATYRD
jgi:predicted anti-sigma-YlaC factor YlaD